MRKKHIAVRESIKNVASFNIMQMRCEANKKDENSCDCCLLSNKASAKEVRSQQKNENSCDCCLLRDKNKCKCDAKPTKKMKIAVIVVY